MKKILITFSLLSMFLSVENVFATSGACSYHSGVNCSASNSSYNGYVVCNDGWVNSSVYASDAEECKTYDPCPKIIYGLSCNTEEDYSKVYSQVQATRGTSAAIEARRGLIGSSFAVSGTLQQDKLDSCRN